MDLPGENHFLQSYPFPDQVTAVSNDTNLATVRDAFPLVRVMAADALGLPFADRTFDIAHSNAVIEHVGPRHAQARFLAEMTRVANAGFVSTPNRWFPVDSHQPAAGSLASPTGVPGDASPTGTSGSR